MTPDPLLSQLLRELGQALGLGALQLNGDACCAFGLETGQVINLLYREAEDELWLFADLGTGQGDKALYAELLRANLFWSATQGATLGLSSDETPRIILTLPLRWRPLDGVQLTARLQGFVATVEDWAERLARAPDASVRTLTSAQEMEILCQSRA